LKLLLDTSFLYHLAANGLSSAVTELLARSDVEVFISAVSLWEMRIKWQSFHASGARKSPYDPQEVILFLEKEPYKWLLVSPQDAATPLQHPMLHKDPFDELLLVQAQIHGLRLLSQDRQLQAHPLVYFA
jgi:PIN domain nuclease of toxin-antitoxin system